MTLLDRYRSHADVLGRTEKIRRFLIGVMLTTRYHLTSRPISNANLPFADRLGCSSDALLALLREQGWPPLAEELERGLAELPVLAELPKQRDSAHEFRRIYKRYFGEMNPPWSALPPSSEWVIDDWPTPSSIFLAVGPNIGIGDELIYFELARRLAGRWPEVPIEVSSFSSGLWNLCDVVSRRWEQRDDQIAPYRRAFELAQQNPNALIVFVEFASTPIYRQLETIATLPRFVYVDTGARCARAVDNANVCIAEHWEKIDGGIYAILDRLLNRLGLMKEDGDPSGRSRWPALPPPRTHRRHPVVLVNPFSSKDYRTLSPKWWSESLQSAAAGGRLFTARVFGGVNAECRDYAQAIADNCPPDIPVELSDTNPPPPVEDTMRAALDSDVIFGLDTFTGHIGVIAPVPCLTVFFSSAWDPWRVRNNHVLNTHVHATPREAGRLLARLLGTPTDHVLCYARDVSRATIEAGADSNTAADAWEAFQRISASVAAWHAADPQLASDFADVPFELATRSRRALRLAARRDLSGAPMERLLHDIYDTWMGSNFMRYARFLASTQPYLNQSQPAALTVTKRGGK